MTHMHNKIAPSLFEVSAEVEGYLTAMLASHSKPPSALAVQLFIVCINHQIEAV